VPNCPRPSKSPASNSSNLTVYCFSSPSLSIFFIIVSRLSSIIDLGVFIPGVDDADDGLSLVTVGLSLYFCVIIFKNLQKILFYIN